MIYSNLWRYCVSTKELPAKFIKPRPRRSRAKRVQSKKNSPLKRAPLLPPETPELGYKEPFSEPYFERFTRRKRRDTGIVKRRRHTRWNREQPESHTRLSKLPTYKKGQIHLLQDGYIDFINTVYGSGTLLLTRWDIEKAWIGLVQAKFEERRLEKRLNQRMFKVLGKALSKVDTSRSRKCFHWWERIQRRRALADLHTRAGIISEEATEPVTLNGPSKITRKRRLSTHFRERLKQIYFERGEGGKVRRS